MIYEYEIRNVNHKYSEIKTIEEMAAKGFRLVAACNYEGGRSLYFERPSREDCNDTTVQL